MIFGNRRTANAAGDIRRASFLGLYKPEECPQSLADRLHGFWPEPFGPLAIKVLININQADICKTVSRMLTQFKNFAARSV